MKFQIIPSVGVVLILVAATLSQAAPSCTGCGKGHVCIIEAGNATHPPQHNCFKICPLRPIICPPCTSNQICIAVGGRCHEDKTMCIPKEAIME